MRFAVVAVLLFLSAVGLGYTYNQNSSVPTFMTAPVERGSIATLVKASGTVEAVVSVDVSSQLSGRIAEVFVNFNDTVRAGQPVAQIDPEIFAARVNEARAALNVGTATAHVQKAAGERAKVALLNAERELQRQLELTRTNSGIGRELDQARAQRAIAEAEQHMAEANLENAQAVVSKGRQLSIRPDLISIAPCSGRRLMGSSSSGTSIRARPLQSPSKPEHCSRLQTICVRWRSTERLMRPMSDS